MVILEAMIFIFLHLGQLPISLTYSGASKSKKHNIWEPFTRGPGSNYFHEELWFMVVKKSALGTLISIKKSGLHQSNRFRESMAVSACVQ